MKFFATDRTNYAALLARLTLGLVMLPHGLQKTLGLFGGPGFSGAMQFLSPIASTPVAFLVILGESLGALGLIFGFITRFCAASIGVIMVGAIALYAWPNGFFLPNGYEFHLLMIGLALSLVVSGGGAYSVDSAIAAKK
jgi:putative oxidoreductase